MPSEPPMFRRQKGGSIGGAGRASERRLARRLEMRETPASGAMEGAKGDMRKHDWLLEAKSTTATSMKLEYRWLGKVSAEASMVNKLPALAITFTHPNGREVRDGKWVMIPEWAFQELLNQEPE